MWDDISGSLRRLAVNSVGIRKTNLKRNNKRRSHLSKGNERFQLQSSQPQSNSFPLSQLCLRPDVLHSFTPTKSWKDLKDSCSGYSQCDHNPLPLIRVNTSTMPSSPSKQKKNSADTEEKDGRSTPARRTGKAEQSNKSSPPKKEGDGDGSDSHEKYTDRSASMVAHYPLNAQRNTESTVPIKYRKFPAKLDAMLSCPEFEPYIAWMAHGRSWKVLDTEGFATFVLPVFFDNQSFNSFIRLVNAWGFRRKMNNGSDRNSYYHEFFLRGKPHLHDRMSRLGPSKKKPIATEPDLFSFPPLLPPTRYYPGDISAISRTARDLARAGALLNTPLSNSSALAASSTAITDGLSQSSNQAEMALLQQENTLAARSIGALGAAPNMQQILDLLQQRGVSAEQSVESLTTLMQAGPPSAASAPVPRDQNWTGYNPFAASSRSTSSATNIEINALLSRAEQHQSTVATRRMLPNNPTQNPMNLRVDQNRDPQSAPALATHLFVEQAARELALRQLQQESSSNQQLLLATFLNQRQQQPTQNHPSSDAPPAASSSPLISSEGDSSQLPSRRLDGTFLMEPNSRVASSESSMVPNYLRTAGIASDISPIIRNNNEEGGQLSAVLGQSDNNRGGHHGIRVLWGSSVESKTSDSEGSHNPGGGTTNPASH